MDSTLSRVVYTVEVTDIVMTPPLDATLYDYEIDDNLSLRVVPTIINDNYLFAQKGSPFAPGLSMSLNF